MTKSRAFTSVFILFVFCVATALTSPAKTTFKSLVSFDSTDGANPLAPLVQGTDGNFYGTTITGGTYGGGTIFKVTPSGTLTVLYNFCAKTNCTDGEQPYGLLVQYTNGDFYGTTSEGGTDGYGTVFKITTTSPYKLTTLHSFDFTDGSSPNGVMLASNGDFYGSTREGGSSTACSTYGCGTIFQITAGGKFTSVFSFDATDGSGPLSGLIQGTDGDLYGTTKVPPHSEGEGYGYGTVFKITTKGVLTTLYNFCSKTNCTDGAYPVGVMVQATNGNFYGTTTNGGTSTFCGTDGCGTAFEITSAGVLTTLYNFCSKTNCTDGGAPESGLMQATDGNFYGSASGGGANTSDCTTYGVGCGASFKLAVTTKTTLTVLHSFDGTDGASPVWLTQGTDGTFYGITIGGGTDESCTSTTYDVNGCGTVFNISTGLAAFVETEPISGKVKAKVTILGSDLTGATSVTFNGTAATYTVVSATEITTTVPTGATTGTVVVKTPSATLDSNVVFTVN